MTDERRFEGTVRWFDEEKGWGFIAHKPAGCQQYMDIFLHFSVFTDETKRCGITEGMPVTYATKTHRKGLRAVLVQRVKPVE